MDQFSAHLDRGWDLVQRGDAQGAELSARRALELESDSPEAYNLLGYAAALRGDFEDAIEHYEQAIALDDSYLEAILNAAELCIYPISDFEAAERYCDDALELAESDEERIDALLLKFDALMGRGQTEAAKALCARLPKEQFENPAHAFLIARAFYEIGDISTAAPLIEEAVRVNPVSPEAYYYQGLIHDEQGHTKTALSAFLKSRELDLAAPSPPWSVSSETFSELVHGVVAALPAEQTALLDRDQIFVADAPGVEVVVDGVDPRALLLLEPLHLEDEGPQDATSNPDTTPTASGLSSALPELEAESPDARVDATVALAMARLFVYQRNLERVAGTMEGIRAELSAMLERELTNYLADDGATSDPTSSLAERSAPPSAQTPSDSVPSESEPLELRPAKPKSGRSGPGD